MSPKNITRFGGSPNGSPQTHRVLSDMDQDKLVRNPAPDSSPPAAPNGLYWEVKIVRAE